MSNGFWEKLPRPIMALAPMADVTDAPFRRIIAKYSKWGGSDIGDGSKANLPDEVFRAGGPDVMFTEFVSADGLFLSPPKARTKLMKELVFSEAERPIVAQFFTAKPEMMRRASRLAQELGFDGVDINMGCPDRSVEKQGAGAGLIKTPSLAVEIILSAKEGAGNLPISVKTRLGYNKDELETWLPALLSAKPSAITIHARTRKEMSEVPARWDRVTRAVEIRDSLKSQTLILGNGDVLDILDGGLKAKESGADGAMLGRAIFGNPWLFSNSHELENRKLEETIATKLKVLVEHAKLFEKLLGEVKNFAVMKKHFKAYVSGWDGAKDLRMRLMETKDSFEVEEVVMSYLKTLKK